MKDNEYYPERPYWHRGPMIFFGFLAGLVGMVVMAFLFGYFVMLLWNWLMPVIFHLGTIGYWQAFGVVLLGKLIFGPFRIGGPRHGRGGRHWKKDWSNGMDWKSGDDWDVKGGWHQWRYYKDYWRSEGKEAFENYIEKMEKGASSASAPETAAKRKRK